MIGRREEGFLDDLSDRSIRNQASRLNRQHKMGSFFQKLTPTPAARQHLNRAF